MINTYILLTKVYMDCSGLSIISNYSCISNCKQPKKFRAASAQSLYSIGLRLYI